MIVPVWIVAFCLFTIGIFLLIRGIQQIQRSVGGAVLLKLPLTQKSGQFDIISAGEYAIWQSGRILQRVPVKMPAPTISALQTGEKVMVHPIFAGVRVNNGWEGRIQLFAFQAKAGQYELDLSNDMPILNSESPYFLEIRERKPAYLLVFGILMLLLGAACLLTGMVLPFI